MLRRRNCLSAEPSLQGCSCACLVFSDAARMRQISSLLWPKLRVLQLYGANTDVGKTIFSTVLCQAFSRILPAVYYLKPVSTGPSDEADHSHISAFAPRSQAKCLYQFSDPVSPHIAVRTSTAVSDLFFRCKISNFSR